MEKEKHISITNPEQTRESVYKPIDQGQPAPPPPTNFIPAGSDTQK